MIRLPPGAVILDPAEVDFIAQGLERFAQLMAERRDANGNPTPTQPSAKLSALTQKLRRSVDSSAALAVTDQAGDLLANHGPPEEPPDARAAQRVRMNAGPHDIGTGDAARQLGITPNAVRDLARRGRLRGVRTGTRWRYDAAAVDALAQQRASQRR